MQQTSSRHYAAAFKCTENNCSKLVHFVLVPRNLQCGTNPVVILRKGEQMKSLTKGESAEIRDGDSFSLIPDMYTYSFHISQQQKRKTPPPSNESSVPSKKSKVDEPKKLDKENEEKQKPKFENKKEEKEVYKQKKSIDCKYGVQCKKQKDEDHCNKYIHPCKYGSSCYRKDPTHFSRFTHPKEETEQKEDKASKQEKGGKQEEDEDVEMKARESDEADMVLASDGEDKPEKEMKTGAQDEDDEEKLEGPKPLNKLKEGESKDIEGSSGKYTIMRKWY